MNRLIRFLDPMEYIKRVEAERTGEFRKLREQCMPEVNVVPFERPAASAERTYIEQKIAAKEAEIGRLGEEIRWLRMELEGM